MNRRVLLSKNRSRNPAATSEERLTWVAEPGCALRCRNPCRTSLTASTSRKPCSRRLGIYRTLTHADIGEYLQSETIAAGLIVAADVFIYAGELDAVFGSVRRLLGPLGCFTFTAEVCEDQKVRLMPTLRYAHSEAYVRDLAAKHGFNVDRIDQAPLRYDQSRPVVGLYVYLS